MPLAEPKETTAAAVVQRPAVQPQENIDEFAAVRGRFLRFVVTRVTNNSEPGIDELEVYGADPKVNLALKGKASASSVIPGYSIHQIPHLNDGKLGNNHSWISAESSGGWAQIEFPEPVEMQKIVWARDRTGVCNDRLADRLSHRSLRRRQGLEQGRRRQRPRGHRRRSARFAATRRRAT